MSVGLPQPQEQAVYLCEASGLVQGQDAVPFDVSYLGRHCRAFAFRFEGHVYAYLNRCAHVPMEMDYQPNRFFDMTGQWLMCATHGAMYSPKTGQCRSGPCRGGLIPVQVHEEDGKVHWHTSPHIAMLDF